MVQLLATKLSLGLLMVRSGFGQAIRISVGPLTLHCGYRPHPLAVLQFSLLVSSLGQPTSLRLFHQTSLKFIDHQNSFAQTGLPFQRD